MFGVSTANLCLGVLLLITNEVAAEVDHHQLLENRYHAVSAAIRAKDSDAVVEIGYRESAESMAELPKVWRTKFHAVARYDTVEFVILSVTRAGDDLIADVDRRIFFEVEGDSVQHFEESRSRDRWTSTDGGWRFAERSLVGSPTTGQTVPNQQLQSPRLRALQTAINRGDASAITTFWTEVMGKCPLVESMDNEPQTRLVTFLWRDNDDVEFVEVHGGPFDTSRDRFDRLPGTDIWYHTEQLPSNSRYVYGLVVRKRLAQGSLNAERREVLVDTYPLDPFNPSVFNAGPVLELPDAPKDSWHVKREGVSRGQLEKFPIESQVLGETRTVRVYTSAVDETKQRSRALAVFLDGEDCEHLMSLPTTFDNLIAEDRIPPLVALLVDAQGSRGRDLVFHDPFINFLADELVPWASRQFNTPFEPKKTVIGGMSLGGLTSAYAAYQRPDVFGNVLSQSGRIGVVAPIDLRHPKAGFRAKSLAGTFPK